jgi:hypothetical protein
VCRRGSGLARFRSIGSFHQPFVGGSGEESGTAGGRGIPRASGSTSVLILSGKIRVQLFKLLPRTYWVHVVPSKYRWKLASDPNGSVHHPSVGGSVGSTETLVGMGRKEYGSGAILRPAAPPAAAFMLRNSLVIRRAGTRASAARPAQAFPRRRLGRPSAPGRLPWGRAAG